MKNIITRFAIGVAILIGNVTTVWAATGRETDNSGLFVWIFLGFCALIVVAQLIPATMMLFGVVKGAKKETAELAPVVAKTAVDQGGLLRENLLEEANREAGIRPASLFRQKGLYSHPKNFRIEPQLAECSELPCLQLPAQTGHSSSVGSQ